MTTEDDNHPLLFIERDEVVSCIESIHDEDALKRLREILNKYQECSVLLDSSLEDMIVRLSGSRDKDAALQALYSLSKVRGRKKVMRFLPHAVEDVHDIWQRLSSNHHGGATWESTYVLWIWMATLSRIPFDTAVLFSDDRLFVDQFFALALSNFDNPGLLREASAVCLASWLSRPDWEIHMARFVEYGSNVLSSSESTNVFRVLAVLQTTVTIVKKQPQLIESLQILPMSLFEEQAGNSALVQKYLIKWWTRWSCTMLPAPRPHRHRSGQRCLFEHSHLSSNEAKCHDIVKDHEQPPSDLFPVPDRVEENVGNLLRLISNPATSVRWSAAKGVGRIAERLPSVCTLDILDAILGVLDEDDPDDTVWHGACLTLAELGRRGLIPPQSLPEIVPYIVRALQLERPSRHSSGAAVRDAACYTYWAFARSYPPSDLTPVLQELNEAILILSLFDRQVNCRRAASAAFQEAVGRQGATNVPHGLDILTVADYFSLGNRSNAYLTVAKEIAKLDTSYRRSILHHLYTSKIYHWDPVRPIYI